MQSSGVLLPGDEVEQRLLPQTSSKSGTIILGPGLLYKPSTPICATNSGSLAIDNRKKAAWLDSNGTGRYVPATGDLVIGIVHHSSVDYYHVSVSPYTPNVSLPQLAFEGASKKTRPILQAGSLIYARVSQASKHIDAELECVHPSTGRSEGLGELKGGMLFDISLGMSRRMMMSKAREDGGIAVLEELAGTGLRFEIAVGRNGRLWVKSDQPHTTIVVGKAIQTTDQDKLSVEQQVKLVRKLGKSI